MPTRSSRPSRPDFNQLAAAIVAEATGEPSPALQAAVEAEKAPDAPPDTRNPAAVALGRLGGLKGGKARAEKLTAAKRKAIAKKAAAARWEQKKKPTA